MRDGAHTRKALPSGGQLQRAPVVSYKPLNALDGEFVANIEALPGCVKVDWFVGNGLELFPVGADRLIGKVRVGLRQTCLRPAGTPLLKVSTHYSNSPSEPQPRVTISLQISSVPRLR